MYHNQTQYNPSPWAQQLPTTTNHHGPPPAKRARGGGGLTITRYPPPPGYKGPVTTHQTPSPAWPQTAPTYSYGQPAYQGYHPPPFSPQMPYQQNAQPAYPQPGFPQPYAYPPPAPQSYTGQPQFRPNTVPAAYPAQSAPWSAHAETPAGYFPDNTQSVAEQHRRRQSSVSNLSVGQTVAPAGLHPHTFTFNPSANDSTDALESEFDDECYFATHPEQIDPSFSLGMIECQTAVSTPFALHATHSEAQLEVLAPRKPRTSDDNCVSEYFTGESREEAFHSVRMTSVWDEIKDDLIFREFALTTRDLIDRKDLKRRFRDRPGSKTSASITTTFRANSPQYTQNRGERDSNNTVVSLPGDGREALQQGSGGGGYADGNADALSNLEHALQIKPVKERDHASDSMEAARSTHTRSNSVASRMSEDFPQPIALPATRNQAQEDILAALGVTGSPKRVYQTPGPAFGAPPAGHTGSARSSRQNSVDSVPEDGWRRSDPTTSDATHGATTVYNRSWDPYGDEHDKTHQHQRGSIPGINTSSRTDLLDDADATPKAKGQQDRRKRTHDDLRDQILDGEQEPDNDATPRQRRKQFRLTHAHE